MTIIHPHERLGLVAENIAGAEVVDSNSYGYSVRIILLMGQEIEHDKFMGSHYGHVLDLVPSRSGEPPAEQWARVTPEHYAQQRERVAAAYAAALAERDRILAMVDPGAGAVNVVFDGPPSPEGCRFIECETDDGRSFRAGEWTERTDGLWQLRITTLPAGGQ